MVWGQTSTCDIVQDIELAVTKSRVRALLAEAGIIHWPSATSGSRHRGDWSTVGKALGLTVPTGPHLLYRHQKIDPDTGLPFIGKLHHRAHASKPGDWFDALGKALRPLSDGGPGRPGSCGIGISLGVSIAQTGGIEGNWRQQKRIVSLRVSVKDESRTRALRRIAGSAPQGVQVCIGEADSGLPSLFGGAESAPSMGVSFGPAYPRGTVTGIVRPVAGNTALRSDGCYILGAAHVMANWGHARRNARLVEPGATLASWDMVEHHRGSGDKDCAIALLTTDLGTANLCSKVQTPEFIAGSMLGMRVTRAQGAAIADVDGVISEIYSDMLISYPDGRIVCLLDQFVIMSQEPFALPGDSGALVLSGRQPVGMVIAGSTMRDRPCLAFATPIDRILKHFGVDLIGIAVPG